MAEKEYTVVAPDGKEITLIGPVGASQEEVIAQAQKLYKPQEQQSSMADKVKALYEVPTALVRGAVDPILANAYGIAKSIPQAIQTGQAPAPIGEQIAKETMQKMQSQIGRAHV